MHKRMWLASLLMAIGSISACDSAADDDPARKGEGAEADSPQRDASAAQADDAAAPASELHELFGYDWTVEPSVEAYWCGYQTLKEDLYISRFHPRMPPGTHHLVVGYQDPVVPDGYVDADPDATTPSAEKCTGVTFGDVFAFVATVGTQELVMPQGVAVKIPKGKQLVFGLHVLNSGTEPISGYSAVDVITPERSEIENEAEVIAAQTVTFNVPPGRSTAEGTCTMVDDTTVFAVLPHMHLAGRHLTTTAEVPGQPLQILYDAPYDFTDQRYARLDPEVSLPKGAKIHVACDYENLGTEPLTPGESTDKNEMCISFVYRYPALLNDDTKVDTSLGFAAPRSWCIN